MTKASIRVDVPTSRNSLNIMFRDLEKLGLIEIVPERKTKKSYRLTKKGMHTYRLVLEFYSNIGIEIK